MWPESEELDAFIASSLLTQNVAGVMHIPHGEKTNWLKNVRIRRDPIVIWFSNRKLRIYSRHQVLLSPLYLLPGTKLEYSVQALIDLELSTVYVHVAVPDRNRILFHCAFQAHHWVWCTIALSFCWGRDSYTVFKRKNIWCVNEVRMSPALSRSSQL